LWIARAGIFCDGACQEKLRDMKNACSMKFAMEEDA